VGGTWDSSYEEDQPVEDTVNRGTHSWADLLRLLDDIRTIAFDTSLDDGDVARRVRDRIRAHDDGADRP
jgi:hypothetical protein